MFFGAFPPTGVTGPVVTVGSFKAIGNENAGTVSVGPLVSIGSSSHGKANVVNQLFGDWCTAPTFWAGINDPDVVDHPISDTGS